MNDLTPQEGLEQIFSETWPSRTARKARLVIIVINEPNRGGK